MTEMQQTKIRIKEQIIAAIKRDGGAVAETLAASLAIEHGLSSRTIKNIIDDMIKGNFIYIEKGHLQILEA